MNKEKEKNIFFSDLEFSDLKDLLIFLKEKNDENTFSSIIIERISRFFPEISSVELMELSFLSESILNKENNSKELFLLFKNKYPNILVDATGKSEIKTKNF
jgi:hypothetical protein